MISFVYDVLFLITNVGIYFYTFTICPTLYTPNTCLLNQCLLFTARPTSRDTLSISPESSYHVQNAWTYIHVTVTDDGYLTKRSYLNMFYTIKNVWCDVIWRFQSNNFFITLRDMEPHPLLDVSTQCCCPANQLSN